MDRARSSLSRHRRRRLQEATQHVSAAHELAAPAAVARQRCYSPRGEGIGTAPEDVNSAVRVLRNAKNGVYHRGLAARALGLLMLHDPDVAARLRLEAEDLVDALLQLVNYCRHASVQNADTRRVHVNCCLVISLLMQTPNQQQQNKSSLVVALDSELLVMESKPIEASSSFLLLTVSGRPESGDGTLRSTTNIDGGRSVVGHAHADGGNRKPTKASIASPTRQLCSLKSSNQQESPPKERKVAWPSKKRPGQDQRATQPTRIHPAQQLNRVVPPANALDASVAGHSTPARVFKMDRFRVVTPAFASVNAQQSPTSDPGRWSNSPVVNPTGGCVMGSGSPSVSASSNNSELTSPRTETSPPSTPLSPSAPPSSSPSSLMRPQHMLEILRTQQMPIASPAFFTRRLRESISRQASSRVATDADGGAPAPVNRLPVVTWGDWKRQHASPGVGQSDGNDEEEEGGDQVLNQESPDTAGEQRDDLSPPQHANHRPFIDSSSQPPSDTTTSVGSSLAQLANTPEAKRQRLREILASPVEPFEKNALHLRSLARRVDSTTMAALDAELRTLTREERGVREQLHAFIQNERDRLPLKFLFALPGGAAYCRHRMRRAMALWMFTFEQNQRRLALLQWKALVEHARFVERGTAYHARAVQMRLKVAIAFVVRNFQQQALRRWVLVTQTGIWLTRDQAVRVIQARARQFLTRQHTLRAHRSARFGQKPPPGWTQLRDDVFLASPRSNVAFRVPLEIRHDMRTRWRAATCVQRTLRRRRFRAYLSKYRVAATKIQSVVRMRAERTRFAAIKKQIIVFQARVRMVACRSVYVKLRDATVLVQLAFRDVRARRLRRLVKCAQYRLNEHKLTGALLIQRVIRGFLGRRLAHAIRHENAERFHAALVVQRAWYRRNDEFSTFLLLGCLREQEGEDLTFDVRVLAFTRATSANCIRRAWVAYLFRKRDQAARQIQREARGFVARQLVAMLRRRRIARRRIKCFLRVRHAERIRVAAKIQFAWLRAVPGRFLRHLRDLRSRTELLDDRRRYELEYDAASRVQALARGYFQGRKLVRHERSARVIQRTYRVYMNRRRHEEHVARLRAEATQRAALQLLEEAVQSATALRLRAMNAAAVQVQRITRGFVTRSSLIAMLVRTRREQQMASRIQRIWRENAWRRAFAQRAKASRSLLEAQRRRQSPTNPFRCITSPPRVLELMLTLAGKCFDPKDELCGISAHEWLWRNGVSARYGDAFQKRAASDGGVDSALSFLSQLRGLDPEDCVERLRSIMIKATSVSGDDSDAAIDNVDVEADVNALVTNLLASRTLQDAHELRRRLVRDQKRHREQYQADTERRRKQLAIKENAARHCQSALDNVLREAEDFRNPPRALCVQRDACVQDLQQATRAVEQAKRELEKAIVREEDHTRLLARRRDEIQREVAPREAVARASLDGFRVLGDRCGDDGSLSERERVARALFLERFPGLEARAAAFSSSLTASGGASVTMTQLRRFLGLGPSRKKDLTSSDVKLAMPELTHFRYSDHQRQHDLLRFTASADVLQLGLERLGELSNVSLEALALGRSRREDVNSSQSRIETIIIDALERSRARPERLSAAEHRARALRDGADTLMALNRVAIRLQTCWRSRASRNLLLALRHGHRREAVKAQYIAERLKDHVTPLWERERQREREEIEAFEREQAQFIRLKALVAVPRFPFIFRAWSYHIDAFVYRKQPEAAVSDPNDGYEYFERIETEGEDYELEAQHSTYSIAEDDAAIKIQARARGCLARRLISKLQRTQRRQRRWDALEREWDATRQERAQLLTLTMDVSAGANVHIKSWWQARRQQSQAARQQPTRSRQPMASSSSTRGKKDREAARSTGADNEIDEAMRARVARVELAYHRSVRSEHRRDWNFPAAARAPNAHGRSILELLRAFDSFQRVAAPRGCISRLSLRYTRAATRFGWKEIRQDGVSFYFHAASGATSWAPPPEYAFEESMAATTVQAFARQLAALRVRERQLSESSFVAAAATAIDRAVQLGGWVGFGLEGLTPGAALCLVGLAKHLPSLSSSILATVSTADDLRAVPADLLRRELQWSVDDVAALQLLPEIDRRAKFPRSPTWKSPPSTTPSFPPSSPSWWPSALQFLPSTRVVNQLVAKRFPNQQGRVQTLVRAITSSKTPISFRQLEMHLRKYGGRPDEAASAAAMREIANLAPVECTLRQERDVFHALARALDRAIVLAANLELDGLHRELSAVRVIVWKLVEVTSDGEDDDKAAKEFKRMKMALPLSSSLTEAELSREETRALAHLPVKGMWEHKIREFEDAKPTLSSAQAALYIRERGLERVLEWERAARLCQSLARMAPVRRQFIKWQRTRQEAARTLQRVYRGHIDRELAARLTAQRASDFVQARDPRSGAFFYVFTPTRERFTDEPVDASGGAVPFRPMVRDRVTQRWLLAWPHFDKSKRKTDAGGGGNGAEDSGSTVSCSVCRVARAARRCNECASPAGDFLDLCLACFADAHASDSPAASHSFSALARATAASFRCVECRRPSTRRCLACDEHYCARCFHRVHSRGNRRASHKSEVYAERAAACAECESRVAEHRCLVCQDTLCEPCLKRSHGVAGDKKRAGRSAHAIERLVQPLEDPERDAHCAQCHVRRGDARCPFCAALLCAVCLEERQEAHAETLACPETALELARARVLGRDALCVECGKPADRECATCGDRYCSVRWMGNPGCFEKFHAKGKRAQHEWNEWRHSAADEQDEAGKMAELATIEEQVRAKRREDARAAEHEAAALAAALRADASSLTGDGGRSKTQLARKRSMKKKTKKKKKKSGVCAVDQCAQRTVSVALPFCTQHLTTQHALEVAKGDPLEAAKLLTEVEREATGRGEGLGKKLARMLNALRSPSSPTAAAETTGERDGKKDKKKRKKAPKADESVTTTNTTQAPEEQ